MNFKNSNIFQVAKKMPPLYHKLPGKEFNVFKSQAICWLIQQPELLEHVWNKIKQSGAVFYSPENGKWQGRNFHEKREGYDE